MKLRNKMTIIAAAAICLLAIGIFTGYLLLINDAGKSQAKLVSNENQPVKLKFGMWEAKTDIEFWREKIKEYSLIKPNITVEVETIPDNGGQYLKVRLAANDLPDLFYLKPGDLFIYKDSLLPLDSLNAMGRNMYPAKFDGLTLGLPLISFTEYVYYHPSVFKEVGVQVPKTLDEFMQVLERIKEHGKYIPIAIGGKENWTFYPFIEFGPPIIAGDSNYLANLTTKSEPFGKGSPFMKAAEVLKTIADKQLAGPRVLEIGFDQATQLFESGQAAMIALGQWYYSDHMSKVDNDDDLDAFALPWRTTETEQLRAITMPDQYMSINKHSKHLEEAAAFLEWVFSPEVYQVYINNSQSFSTLTDVSSVLPFFNRVNNKHPFYPLLYFGMNENYVKLKSAAHFDEKKRAQEIFAGAPVQEMANKINENWRRAVEDMNQKNEQ